DRVVRRAYADDTRETLDGKTRTLHPEALLITDASGPVGLSGGMDWLATEDGEATTEIVIEDANFDQVSSSRSQRRHRLPSEASNRNARGVDWAIADKAAQRVAELLAEYAGGTIDAGVTDVGEQPASPTIRLRADYPSNLIGHDYTEDQINQVLV